MLPAVLYRSGPVESKRRMNVGGFSELPFRKSLLFFIQIYVILEQCVWLR